MTNFAATVVLKGKGGELEGRGFAKAKRTFAAGIANTDTITISAAGLFPNRKIKLLGGRVFGIEIDTNATPTALFTIGDATDPDGYLTSKGAGVGLQNSLAGQLYYEFDGAYIGTTITPADVILLMTAAVATSATTGDLWFEFDYEPAQ